MTGGSGTAGSGGPGAARSGPGHSGSAGPVPTARELARQSQAVVAAKDRAGRLGLFAPDAVVQDPVGPSPLDPAGQGHHGRDAIAAFYDTVIAPTSGSASRSSAPTCAARRSPTSA